MSTVPLAMLVTLGGVARARLRMVGWIVKGLTPLFRQLSSQGEEERVADSTAVAGLADTFSLTCTALLTWGRGRSGASFSKSGSAEVSSPAVNECASMMYWGWMVDGDGGLAEPLCQYSGRRLGRRQTHLGPKDLGRRRAPWGAEGDVWRASLLGVSGCWVLGARREGRMKERGRGHWGSEADERRERESDD